MRRSQKRVFSIGVRLRRGQCWCCLAEISWSGSKAATIEAISSRFTGSTWVCSMLFSSNQRKGMRRNDADAEKNAGCNQNNHDSKRENIGPPGTDEVAHNLAVIDQHVQEQ